MEPNAKPATPEEYIDSLPEDRQSAVRAIRDEINRRIPVGFKECIAYGMIGWVVPKKTYPAGYHCDPSKPLMLMSLGNNKTGISLHHLGLYGNAELLAWFQDAWAQASARKLDMGKGCIRFKHPDEIPLTLVGELASKLTPDQWVQFYENAMKARR